MFISQIGENSLFSSLTYLKPIESLEDDFSFKIMFRVTNPPANASHRVSTQVFAICWPKMLNFKLFWPKILNSDTFFSTHIAHTTTRTC